MPNFINAKQICCQNDTTANNNSKTQWEKEEREQAQHQPARKKSSINSENCAEHNELFVGKNAYELSTCLPYRMCNNA